MNSKKYFNFFFKKNKEITFNNKQKMDFLKNKNKEDVFNNLNKDLSIDEKNLIFKELDFKYEINNFDIISFSREKNIIKIKCNLQKSNGENQEVDESIYIKK